MPKAIKNYKLISEFCNENSGFSRWAFAEKNGEIFFIKEFLSPVFPNEDAPISLVVRNSKIKDCEEFEKRKRRLYSVLKESETGNIISVIDFFRFKSKYYIVTEKVEIVKNHVQMVSKLSEENKIIVLKVLAHSLCMLHSKGIVHSDLKPNNILVKETIKGRYTAKIIDFDSSFLIDDPPKDCEELNGDLVYFAPEALLFMTNGSNIDYKIDVFSLGIIFHEFYAGTLPKFSEKYAYIFETVLSDGNLQLDSTLPIPIAKLIREMLHKDPTKRPDLSKVFDRLAIVETISAVDTMPLEREASEAISAMKEKSGYWKIPDEL